MVRSLSLTYHLSMNCMSSNIVTYQVMFFVSTQINLLRDLLFSCEREIKCEDVNIQWNVKLVILFIQSQMNSTVLKSTYYSEVTKSG